jgi:polysaccharide deacetylase family protein (PEP-CTERM system associated)
VVENTFRVLDLLDRHGAKATFFVLGWVARKAPRVVTEIARRGHEVGCHSFWHRLVYKLSPDEFRADLREATAAIEDAAQVKLKGYRAPTYSITPRSAWALDILAEEGYAFDSSIFPIRHDLYGYPSFPRFPVTIALADGNGACPSGGRSRSIVEFPASTVRLLGRNMPGPGGGYLRIFPLRYAHWALRRIGGRDKMPASVYFHPWEIDPDQPRLGGPFRSKIRHYTRIKDTERRLETLLQAFRFAPMSQVLETMPAPEMLHLETS